MNLPSYLSCSLSYFSSSSPLGKFLILPLATPYKAPTWSPPTQDHPKDLWMMAITSTCTLDKWPPRGSKAIQSGGHKLIVFHRYGSQPISQFYDPSHISHRSIYLADASSRKIFCKSICWKLQELWNKPTKELWIKPTKASNISLPVFFYAMWGMKWLYVESRVILFSLTSFLVWVVNFIRSIGVATSFSTYCKSLASSTKICNLRFDGMKLEAPNLLHSLR